jgi:epsilon-lactone hydrolase
MWPGSSTQPTQRALVRMLVFLLGATLVAGVRAQNAGSPNALVVDEDGTVHVPAQSVPPSKFLSPEGKAYLAEHLKKVRQPQQLQQANDNGVPPLIAGYLDRQRVLFPIDKQDTTVGGVHAFVYTPRNGVSPRNKGRVLIDLHGGGFSGCWPGCAELESIPVAALGGIRVVSLDYREAPKYRFPAASEDVAAAYSELLKTYRAKDIGIYGCSAGGMLTGEVVAWFQQHDLPAPGAVGIFCAGMTVPDRGFGGDADYTATPIGEARMVAMPPPSDSKTRRAAGSLLGYFEGSDLRSPLVSPAISPRVLAKFPPSLIITGTRGFELSSAVYTHTQLVKNGAASELHVWEGMFHGFFYNPDVPESRDCYDVIVRFFDRELGKH